MNLKTIKVEMRRINAAGNHNSPYSRGFEDAINHYEYLLSNLDPPEPLRRVREKVEKVRGYNYHHDKDLIDICDVMDIIDAELKEKEMKKQKIEIEVEIPEGYEVDRYGSPLLGEHYINQHGNLDAMLSNATIPFSYLILRPIAPPLELETKHFMEEGEKVSDFLEIFSDTLTINEKICEELSAAEARDLAKILNYWAETGKLPERVVVKRGGK
jgi:hypothetical protein